MTFELDTILGLEMATKFSVSAVDQRPQQCQAPCWKCKLSGSAPDLLNRKQGERLPRGF